MDWARMLAGQRAFLGELLVRREELDAQIANQRAVIKTTHAFAEADVAVRAAEETTETKRESPI